MCRRRAFRDPERSRGGKAKIYIIQGGRGKLRGKSRGKAFLLSSCRCWKEKTHPTKQPEEQPEEQPDFDGVARAREGLGEEEAHSTREPELG